MIYDVNVFIVDTHVLLEIKNESNNVSCTLVYYQIGKESMYLNSNLALIYHIISKRCSQYFSDIEYIAKTQVMLREAGGIRGLIIAIESFMDPYVIQRHIRQFISHILVIIKRYTQYIYPERNFSYKNIYKYILTYNIYIHIYKHIYNYIQNMSIYGHISFFLL